MRREGFTLIEMIVVIVISATLAAGSFKAMQMLYLKSAKAKAVTDMTSRGQIVLDQIGVMLYNRIAKSVIGYTPNDNVCESIADLSASRPVLEWLGVMDDELINKQYDGFIDIGSSDSDSDYLAAQDIDAGLDSSDVNLVFAGVFDAGPEESKACEGAFGWHGNDSNLSFDIDIDDDNITITDTVKDPEYIYEKYYLTKTAYAVARGEDVDQEATCIKNYNISSEDINNTLFLFRDYQPWQGETYCGDKQGTKEGKVSILAKDINAFEAIYENETIRLNIDMNRTIRGSKSPVHVYKQKVVF